MILFKDSKKCDYEIKESEQELKQERKAQEKFLKDFGEWF